jgi:type II secretory pathway pseudopilin PulG
MVMMLLCVVAAMAVPSLRGFGKGRRVGTAAAQVVALAQYARTQAITRGVPHRLNVDPETGTYWITVQRYGAFEAAGEEFGRVFEAPEGVAVEWYGPTSLAGDGFAGPGGRRHPYVEFAPTGRTSYAVSLLLRDADGEDGDAGAAQEVACLSPAEPFRVLQDWELGVR